MKIYLIFEVDKRGNRDFYGAYKDYITALGKTQILNRIHEDDMETYEMRETNLN